MRQPIKKALKIAVYFLSSLADFATNGSIDAELHHRFRNVRKCFQVRMDNGRIEMCQCKLKGWMTEMREQCWGGSDILKDGK